jgi:rhodanese-related sulfurtransferase
MRRFVAGLFMLLFAVPIAAAEPVGLTPDVLRKEIVIAGQTIVIGRNQDNAATLPAEFARTSRPCPPFCIAPMTVAPGVETLGELELVAFLETTVARGRGVLIDSRLPEFYVKGAIPGAVNVPFTALDPANPYRDAILEALGAVRQASGWDFSGAQELAMYCNGPWCEQSPRAIRHLLDAGYPAAKLRYYRGGMQDWLSLGLTTVLPPGTN